MTVPAPSRVLLGISGSIAAYKTPDLVRQLRAHGAEVRVILTASARAFVAPLSLQAVAGTPPRAELFDAVDEAGLGHIALARWAELLLIAPASAHLIARLAHGLADDLLTTVALASQAPLLLAPAMNSAMWQHPATQDNVARLTARGARWLGPAEGEQACGETGPGRMLEPAEIAARVFGPRPLAGVATIVTAGPTREALDPVRFLGNRSSGKMGYALAAALSELGATVTLVSGPTALAPPPVAVLVAVESALEMHAAVMARIAGCRLFVAVAAVADYRPECPSSDKIKKDAESLTLRLVRNPDILAEVAARSEPPFTVGFAAETDAPARAAAAKLATKRLKLIAANQVGGRHGGFEHEDNALLVLWPGGERQFPMQPKAALARELALLIAERYALSTTG